MSLLKLTTITAIALLATGCATDHGKSVAEAKPDSFVNYKCENNKSFSARFSPETGSVRIRTLEGSAELIKGDRGLFRDESGHWILTLGANSSTELVLKGKKTHAMCVAE